MEDTKTMDEVAKLEEFAGPVELTDEELDYASGGSSHGLISFEQKSSSSAIVRESVAAKLYPVCRAAIN